MKNANATCESCYKKFGSHTSSSGLDECIEEMQDRKRKAQATIRSLEKSIEHAKKWGRGEK